jgi:hypothetical protein
VEWGQEGSHSLAQGEGRRQQQQAQPRSRATACGRLCAAAGSLRSGIAARPALPLLLVRLAYSGERAANNNSSLCAGLVGAKSSTALRVRAVKHACCAPAVVLARVSDHQKATHARAVARELQIQSTLHQPMGCCHIG